MLYRYKAYDPEGNAVTGEVDAHGSEAAMVKLRSQGLLVDSLRLAPSLKVSWNADLGSPKLTLRQQAVFFNLLALLLDGGVPVLQALQVLAGTTRGPMQLVMQRMAAEVESGHPLSRAMASQRGVFPRLAIHIVSVSELAGELEAGLRLLAEQFDAEDLMIRKFKSAMIYPTVVMVMALGLAVFMTVFIVPSFAGMFKDLGAELPWQTQALLSVSEFMQAYWYLLIGGLGAAAGGFVYGKRRSESFRMTVDRLLLRVPVFGPLVRNRETARYSRTLGTMMKSGVPVMTAAQSAADLLENAFMSARLMSVPDAIANGDTLGQAVKATGVLPPILAELLVVGEVIGKTDTTLTHIATVADTDVKQTLDRLTAILEPVLIFLLGGIVLCVVVPLLLPMFDVYTKIK